MAVYRGGVEVWSAVFDATASTSVSWLDCRRLLYASPSDFSGSYAIAQSYTCSLSGYVLVQTECTCIVNTLNNCSKWALNRVKNIIFKSATNTAYLSQLNLSPIAFGNLGKK
ncbi:hypothetical protein DPMN_097271 [Dreissena polymorpha]|uniref:Uncharacterized protein n=1 Tax=Dreissena polymorpha TaxID=45954 RepID=A0A9D4LA05_DREPO|nr:hypothetical protein DPMN_097271 [Dreissena polymorpha]